MKLNSVMWVVSIIIGLIIIAYVAGAMIRPIMDAGNNITDSRQNISGTMTGLPLGGLFSGSGILVIIIIIALFVGIYYMVAGKGIKIGK